MNYIVLDLEWNNGESGQENPELSFEIIEFGAIKMNDDGVMFDEFSELVKPQVYQSLNHITSKLIHMQMEELERGKDFAEVARYFLDWCGEDDFIYCTWGPSDLTVLQKNMRFYNMTVLSDGPFAFLDVQKLFSIAYEDRKSRKTLEYAVDFLRIEKDIPFHRAFSDAYYTAKVLTCIMDRNQEALKNVSYDVFTPPKNRGEEVKTQFDTYMKYISRKFDDKTQAFADKEVISSKCYLCHRNLRKKIKWFTANGRHYYCVAYCEKHGYLKGKIRVRKAEDGQVYIVKTTKFITREEVDAITKRKDHAKELRRKHNAAEEQAAKAEGKR